MVKIMVKYATCFYLVCLQTQTIILLQLFFWHRIALVYILFCKLTYLNLHIYVVRLVSRHCAITKPGSSSFVT